MDLSAETYGRWRPKTAQRALASAASPSGVEVAWALTWSMSAGASPAAARAAAMERARPSPEGTARFDPSEEKP